MKKASIRVYDLIIIGAGPAGLSAAVYAARYKLKTIVIGMLPGGMAAWAPEICNLIGFTKIKGYEFALRMQEQVKALGVEIIPEEVSSITAGKLFTVKTGASVYRGKKLILAMGREKRKLGLPNEGRLMGRGVSYCATCDGPLFASKQVAVIGGSNSALTAALLLAEVADKVYVVHRGTSFPKADPAWVELVCNHRKIKCLYNCSAARLLGEDKVEGIELDTGKKLAVQGIFVEVGAIPNTALARQLGIELEQDYINVDGSQRTSLPGIFAAGDITNNPLKQIVLAAAQGATAATNAYQDLLQEK